MRREMREIEKAVEDNRYSHDAVVYSTDIRMNDEPDFFLLV